MDENNQKMPTNTEQPSTLVNPGVKNSSKYFFVALTAIVLGAVVLVFIFLWAFPKTSDEEKVSTSTEINTSTGLDKATTELDNTDLTTIDKDLQANDTDASSF